MKSSSDSLERSEMLTRRTATVIMSAPEASCACTITAGDEYFPVPTMSRDAKVLPAMTKLSITPGLPRLPATDEVHDFDLIALADLGAFESRPFEHDKIVFDGD